MKYVKEISVRRQVRRWNKRCPRGWLLALDLKIDNLIDRECAALGSKATLSAEDSMIRWGIAKP